MQYSVVYWGVEPRILVGALHCMLDVGKKQSNRSLNVSFSTHTISKKKN